MSDSPLSFLLRRKPVEAVDPAEEGAPAEGEGLERSLGLLQLTAIGVGGIIGAGIFSLAGTVANETAGPAVLVSFLVAGVASAAAAFSYAEFAGMIPKAGSAYTYGYVSLGEGVAWFIGWDLLLEYTAIVAVVAIGVSGYFGFLVEQLGASPPEWMMGAPQSGDGRVVDLFAVVLCLGTAWLLTRGIRSAARFELVVVGLKVLLVLVIVGLGIAHIDSANYTPYFPYGVGGAITGAGVVFFAVFGYDAMSTAAEESRDATKHMPRAIILSLVVAMVLYVLATLVLTGMQSYRDIDPESGFSSAFEAVGQPGVANVIAIGAIVSILTVMITFMLGVTRVWYSMSRDGLLPAYFAKTSSRHVPARITWIVGVGSALLAGFLPIGEVAELTNIGILLAFVVVCVAVIVLRYRRPEIPRAFRCPLMPVVPAVGVLFSLGLALSLPLLTWERFGLWFLIGLAVYLLYGRRHSALRRDGAAQGGADRPT